MAALWPLWAALLALPVGMSASLFFVRNIKVPKSDIAIDACDLPDPFPEVKEPIQDPLLEPPAYVSERTEEAPLEPEELLPEQPSVFEVPPDHGPVASVPPAEAFDPQEQADLVSHINNVLRDAPVLARGPINPLGDAVLHKIADGELLGSLLAQNAPDAIDLRALNAAPTGGPALAPELALENHTLLVNAAASVGAAVPQIHETQLLFAPDNKQVALQQAYNIIKNGLLSKINAATVPFLAQLLEDGEKPGQVPPEALLSRWVNKHVDDYLMQHPQDRRRLPTEHVVSEALDGDITTQLAMALHQAAKEPLLSVSNTILPTVPIVPNATGSPSSGAWATSGATTRDPAMTASASVPSTVLMPQSAAAGGGGGPPPGAAPGSTSLSMPIQQTILPTTVQMPLAAANAGEGLPELFWRASPDARAKQVIDHAIAAAGPKIFAVAPSDLTEPRPRMQQCFVASVVNALGAGGGEEGELDTYEEETNDSAEARVFKNWAASLGLKLNMKDLFSDSCSGIVLLKVMERLQPGSVDWDRVKGTPKNKYEKVANCNYAVKMAKELGLKLTGISGQDIAEGNEKLLLAVWWQLMRKDFMQFLDELDMDQAHVLTWANAQVARRGTDIQLSRFGDPAIKSGVFLLQLMKAVAPKAIKEDDIKPGRSELDRQLNAKLAISTSHKMGARVFCGWQDILEARPKLMLSMVAAIMSVYLKTNNFTKDDVLRDLRRGSVALQSMRASQRGSGDSLRPADAQPGTKLAMAWAKPHVAGASQDVAAKMASNWAKPHKLVEAMKDNLDADGRATHSPRSPTLRSPTAAPALTQAGGSRQEQGAADPRPRARLRGAVRPRLPGEPRLAAALLPRSTQRPRQHGERRLALVRPDRADRRGGGRRRFRPEGRPRKGSGGIRARVVRSRHRPRLHPPRPSDGEGVCAAAARPAARPAAAPRSRRRGAREAGRRGGAQTS